MASNPAIFPGDHVILRFPDRTSRKRLTVSTESLANYSSIQDAINHASAGDTIVIGAGIYCESLVIDKPVHLVGPVDPRFVTGDEMHPAGDVPYALVIGATDVTVDWSAPGGSIRDLAISRVPSASTSETSALVRMNSGRLQLKRCVLSEGAHTAVDSRGGELDIVRCHMRDIDLGISVVNGFVNVERSHVEGVEVIAANVESSGSISLTDACFEGRTLLAGEVRAFEGNDFDLVFMSRPVPVGNNRISSLVHLCGFQIAGEVAVSL